MQDATGNRRVGMLGGREYLVRLGGFDCNFSAETAPRGHTLLDSRIDLRGGDHIGR